MKFFFSHLLIIFISTFLVACTQKTLYLTPETTGYIYIVLKAKNLLPIIMVILDMIQLEIVIILLQPIAKVSLKFLLKY